MTAYHQSLTARRVSRLYRVAAFLPLAFIPAAWRLGVIGMVVAAVVAAVLVTLLWRREDRVDTVRTDDAGLTFLRRTNEQAMVGWDELRTVRDAHRELVWTWDGGGITTVEHFDDQQDLFAEIARRAPNVAPLPSQHRSGE